MHADRRTQRTLTRPERVKFLGKPIAIQYVAVGDPLLKFGPDDDHPGVAISYPDRQLIAVEDGQPLASEQDALLHECIHIIEDYMDIRVSEKAVTKLATGLLGLIQDNPKLVTYLRRKA